MFGSVEAALAKRRIRSAADDALEWLWSNKRGFETANATANERLWQIKPLTELILLLIFFRKHAIRSEALQRLTEVALQLASEFDWHEYAAYDPSTATPLVLVESFFVSEGQLLPLERSFVSFLKQIKYFDGADRLPYREMDYRYCLGLTGSSKQEETLTAWFSYTAFGRNQHVARYNIDDLYSLTHAVFYLTDVGLRTETNFLAADTARRLKKEIVESTVIMLRVGNIDLLAELMLCWLFCRIPKLGARQIIFDAAVERILASRTTDGAVAPTPEVYERTAKSKGSFDDLYHTTLVAALLFALLLKNTT